MVKKTKRTNNDLQNTAEKQQIENHELHNEKYNLLYIGQSERRMSISQVVFFIRSKQK